MSSYCASCLADLALVRDAVTSVNGTAACVAHAVLLTHPGDTPQRRLQRLSELRSMAEGKLATASTEDVPAIELLVQEYALAGAMDMSVPLRDIAGERTPRPPKKRRERDRGRDRERGPREFPVESRTAEAGATDRANELSGSQGAMTTSQPDNSGASAAGQELSGSQGAMTTSQPDNSGASAAGSGAPAADTSQEPASREPQPSPEPSPQGDGLLAPQGVNSASTTGQESGDAPSSSAADSAPAGASSAATPAEASPAATSSEPSPAATPSEPSSTRDEAPVGE